MEPCLARPRVEPRGDVLGAADATQDLGDRWVRESRSVVLEVPSVLIPGESNYLINPGHPEFRSVSIGPAEAFAFNPRLL